MVANETTGNINRPPYRSVSAPTGIRPSAPTITGTATIRACWKLVSPSASLKCAPSGDSSAQAQNVSANPMVAMPSMTYGRRPAAVSPAVPGRLTIVAMAHPSLDRRQAAARRPRIPPRFAPHAGEPEGTNDPTGPPFGPRLTMGAGVSSRWLSVTGFESAEPIMTPDAVGGATISHHDIVIPMAPADIRLARRKPAPTRLRTGIRRRCALGMAHPVSRADCRVLHDHFVLSCVNAGFLGPRPGQGVCDAVVTVGAQPRDIGGPPSRASGRASIGGQARRPLPGCHAQQRRHNGGR